MPRRDGTGPKGLGPKTGKGLGVCNKSDIVESKLGRGFGCKIGYRRNKFGRRFASSNNLLKNDQ